MSPNVSPSIDSLSRMKDFIGPPVVAASSRQPFAWTFLLFGAASALILAAIFPRKQDWTEWLMPYNQEAVLNHVAKLLGYFIIGLSLVLKMPQILRIIKTRSIQGLSVPSFELECVGYTVSCAYCWTMHVPFSAYGELTFLTMQGVALVLLLYHFSRKRDAFQWVKISLYLVGTAVLLQGWLQPSLFEAIYNFQTVMFFLSRLPQMWQNFAARNTGELSLGTSAMSVGSCLIRLFTSIQEQAPKSMVFSSALGLCSHGLLLAQILVYSSNHPNHHTSSSKPSTTLLSPSLTRTTEMLTPSPASP